jgi:serine/threonine protein kinase
MIIRDIKPQNIMVKYENDEDWPIKIVDFGLSTILGHSSSLLCGTPLFMAPEVWREKLYSQKSDIWSCGMLLYFLLNGGKSLTGITNPSVLKHLIRDGTIFESIKKELLFLSPEGIGFINLMLLNKFDSRPTAKELLTHKWFSTSPIPVIPQQIQQNIFANMQTYKVPL